ncbi:MAG: hypothetical protein IJ560_02835 [Alphaproteobacteria bacterium]|nr:hypothetical protein [Alphaproteobacteria bacterium]
MTLNEFLIDIKSRGALFWPRAAMRDVTIADAQLQSHRCARLPEFMIKLYSATAGINLGTGYIFGPTELVKGNLFPVPSINQINDEMVGNNVLRGMTIFGRNDLFWFAFDAFGTCYMLDNLGLRQMRKYDDPYRAMMDCLVAGKY